MPNIIRINGGGNQVPSIFGNGADGDLVVTGTTTLPVTVPHQSIIEKQYKSLTINAGAILKCASWNAGLILRVKGDCTIHGTIDQSGMAPKTNPPNNYPYPAQVVCGDGGGGTNTYQAYGGTGMLKRPYGGGYSAGGAGGYGSISAGGSNLGGSGGSSTDITINTLDSDLFKGGPSEGAAGELGGGGAGGHGKVGSSGNSGGVGGTGAGANGGSSGGTAKYGGGGGGAGNYGGGVILLYIGGNLFIDGQILCNGLDGGNGGYSDEGQVGGAGGGAGGGAIYIFHRGIYTNTGLLQVNGGKLGTGTNNGNGSVGGIGSITVIQGDK